MVELPSWAQVTDARRSHIERVARIVRRWAAAMATPSRECARWLRAAALHDTLKDAPLALLRELAPEAWGIDALRHGPAAARMAERKGETDVGVLNAVHYHSVGFAGWDDVGRMLYLADYLEPGRRFPLPERAELTARVPLDRDSVLCAVVRHRLKMLRSVGREPLPETLGFWESLQCGD